MAEEDATEEQHEDEAAEVEVREYEEDDMENVEDVMIDKYDGEHADTYEVVYTLDGVMSLTFDSIMSKEDMAPLLDQLDEFGITATFFGSPEQLDMYPEGVEETLARGHNIENNGLYGMDVEKLRYEDIYQRVKMTNEMIETSADQSPSYVYVSRNDNEDVNAITAQLNMSGVITPVSELNASDDADAMQRNVREAVARGGVLSMNPSDEELIPHLYEAADEVNFDFVSLDALAEADEGRKDFEDIEGAGTIQINEDMTGIEPFHHYQQPTTDKEVALTFDDWASEAVVLEVLDILDVYDIQSTFYLKSEKIQDNPNLARLLIERGHEVANHTHSHPDTTTLTPKELQEDVYHAHQIITEAIQEQPMLYFRPPFGRIDDEASYAVSAMGYEVIGMYDVSSYDWNDEYTEADVINRVMTNIQPGSVIVMHILDDIHTPAVLGDVIESIQAEGYEFVLTSDWLNE